MSEVKGAKILQLVPYMHRKFIITTHEHELLTNPQVNNLQRGNLLAQILNGRNVHWLLKFCHCLIESYESERGLDAHYILFQRVKGEGMCICYGNCHFDYPFRAIYWFQAW